ncbi:FecR family protein [Azovibrio restrictus]|uniref:FecR family protein n=1 Tax=Azovibrio restrictus TaxID=146938 RepID=UPI00041BD533|nr:FecR family protein [Azovibrio restrictus]
MKTCQNRLVLQSHIPVREALLSARGNFWFWLMGLLLLVSCLRPALASEGSEKAVSQAVGEVVFVAGEASLQRDGQWQGLQKGRSLQEGDTVRTAANGHVHLRMLDKGFIAVRPGSTLTLKQYRYNPDQPEENRVLLYLENGVARTISGKAGEANREKYRFTTPVAAIGLRGTDYVVQAETALTRVSVLKGAVVVSPLGGGCGADLAAGCSSRLARELNASNPNAYLEVRLRGNVPEVILQESSQDGPGRKNQIHPEEPRAVLEKEVIHVLSGSLAPEPPRGILWGRWSGVATPTPTLVSLVDESREVAFGNELFGLLKPVGSVALPAGTVSLNYGGGEAWLKSDLGQLTSVALSDGSLSLDFNRRQFQTSLQAQLPSGSQQLHANGSITFQGAFFSNASSSNMNVSGVVTSNAQEAGYLFDSKQPGGTLFGATYWKR